MDNIEWCETPFIKQSDCLFMMMRFTRISQSSILASNMCQSSEFTFLFDSNTNKGELKDDFCFRDRPTVKQCLQHPWVARDSEPPSPSPWCSRFLLQTISSHHQSSVSTIHHQDPPEDLVRHAEISCRNERDTYLNPVKLSLRRWPTATWRRACPNLVRGFVICD